VLYSHAAFHTCVRARVHASTHAQACVWHTADTSNWAHPAPQTDLRDIAQIESADPG
jgi:hypothetical protein